MIRIVSVHCRVNAEIDKQLCETLLRRTSVSILMSVDEVELIYAPVLYRGSVGENTEACGSMYFGSN